MKQLNIITIPENTYTLTNEEISLIHAMACYFSSVKQNQTGMTKHAYNLVGKMEEQFRMHDGVGEFQVWE